MNVYDRLYVLFIKLVILVELHIVHLHVLSLLLLYVNIDQDYYLNLDISTTKYVRWP